MIKCFEDLANYNFIQLIVDRSDLDLLIHPGILKILKLKRRKFGRFWLGIEAFFHVMLTLVCTTASLIGSAVDNKMSAGSTYLVIWSVFFLVGEVMVVLRAANVSVYIQCCPLLVIIYLLC